MNKFGKFEGIEVYEVDLREYVNRKLYEDTKYIYLINGDLIKDNIIFGTWNGKVVHEYNENERKQFFTIATKVEKKRVEIKEEIAETASEELKILDVDEILNGVYLNDLLVSLGIE
jgi:hypothetical protein